MGVEKVESGYSGGSAADPTYEQVSSGLTGHAETIRIEYKPDKISYKELLEVFFSFHDPTTLNRQGSDVGNQYRSAIFYKSQNEKLAAEETIAGFQKAGIWEKPIVTEIVPFTGFYGAEEYHQHFYEKNPNHSYCLAIIAPKLAKLRGNFSKKSAF